jgi:hypothetical protein
MHCYVCAKQGVEQAAVALCRSCSAGLCLQHLRETATQFASDHILAPCHHDTWTAINPGRERDTAAAPTASPSARATADGGHVISARPGWRVRTPRPRHRA